jgi:hypothetical protein
MTQADHSWASSSAKNWLPAGLLTPNSETSLNMPQCLEQLGAYVAGWRGGFAVLASGCFLVIPSKLCARHVRMFLWSIHPETGLGPMAVAW